MKHICSKEIKTIISNNYVEKIIISFAEWMKVHAKEIVKNGEINPEDDYSPKRSFRVRKKINTQTKNIDKDTILKLNGALFEIHFGSPINISKEDAECEDA